MKYLSSIILSCIAVISFSQRIAAKGKRLSIENIFEANKNIHPVSDAASAGDWIAFDFEVVENEASVSAGIYAGDRLIRTVFSKKSYSKGWHTEYIEPFTDLKKDTIASLNGLTIKVLTTSSTAVWRGAQIGNTSADTNTNSPYRFNGYNPPYAMIDVKGKLYMTNGYNEGRNGQYYSYENDFQKRTRIFGNGTNITARYVCSDGQKVYWTGVDNYANPQVWGTFATDISTDNDYYFTKLRPYKRKLGRSYPGGLLGRTTDSLPTGTTVDEKYFYVAIKSKNCISVFDKITGLPFKTVLGAGIANVENDGKFLWVQVGDRLNKYSKLSITNILPEPIVSIQVDAGITSIRVNPYNDFIYVTSDHTNQLKIYHRGNGLLTKVMGSGESYAENALVNNYKYYFRGGSLGSDVAFQSDGKFWLLDGGNYRAIRYNPDYSYDTMMAQVPAFYSVQVDPLKPERVFAAGMEYQIDWNRINQPGFWKLKANWLTYMDNAVTGFKPILAPNGKTYVLLLNKKFIYELMPDYTLRNTGVAITQNDNPDNNMNLFQSDNSAYKQGVDKVYKWRRLQGFDKQNNPVYSYEIFDTVTNPSLTWTRLIGNAKQVESDRWIFYNKYRDPEYHLGLFDRGSNNFIWQSLPATKRNYRGGFPNDHYFDVGNNVRYPGGNMFVIGDYIVVSYHGEFWRNGQVSKYFLFHKSGLLVSQFGYDLLDESTGKSANVFDAAPVIYNGNLYLLCNDESKNGGIGLWELKNFEVNISDYKPRWSTDKVSSTINLMGTGLTDGELVNGTAGWERSPALNDFSSTDNLTYKVGSYSYSPFGSDDISAEVNMQTDYKVSLSKNIGDFRSSNYTISGQIMLNTTGTYLSTDSTAKLGSYLEVLDINSRAIFRIQKAFYRGQSYILSNKVKVDSIINTDSKLLDTKLGVTNPFSFSYSNGKLTATWMDVSANINLIDPKADPTKPKFIRWVAWKQETNIKLYQAIAIKDLRLQLK